MVERKSSSRVGNTAAMKARTKSQEDYILLARGLSARLTGANTPLTPLTADEMERDLRHMEAFSNACTSYAQQYYIFTNQNSANSKENAGDGAGSNNISQSRGQGRSGATGSTYRGGQVPIIAMPVRIDPEEEKRLQTLRQKIQQCEAQREIYEGQYLSLRAHYISLSKKLKGKREDVDSRILFLQEQVKKRGRLLALQRVRIQMVRETLLSLRHRLANPLAPASKTKEDQADLFGIWTNLDQQWKEAEENIIKSNNSSSKDMIVNWPASKVPKIPPGVPLLLSQLGLQPGNAVAWGTCGAFGAKPDSLVWIENQVPTKRPDRSKVLPGLRDDVAHLKREIAREQSLNRKFQSNAIKMRQKNDELVSMMTLLRSETEAVVARHNVLLESEEAKKASQVLYEEEAMVTSVVDTVDSNSVKKTEIAVGSSSDRNVSGDGNVVDPDNKSVPKISGLKEDDENDGDDEGGGEEEEDEGEINDGGGKRPMEEDNDSSRSKRRKL